MYLILSLEMSCIYVGYFPSFLEVDHFHEWRLVKQLPRRDQANNNLNRVANLSKLIYFRLL